MKVIGLILIVYLVVLLFAFFFADRVMFQPPPASYQPSPDFITLTDAQGTRIAAAYLGNPASRYTILYSHGNGEDLGDILPWLRVLHERGFSVISYDYPGYGLSGGTPSEAGAVAAAEAAFTYLTKELNVPPERIVLHGYSVGGGPAAELAARHEVGGLVLESTFTTAFRTVTRIALLPFDRFRTIDRMPRIKAPVMLIHGRRDKIIPFWHGERLFEAARGAKVKLWVEDGGHWDLRDAAGDSYWQTWREFLRLLDRR